MMKIDKVNTFVVQTELDNNAFAYSQGWYNSRSATIVEIVCDNGIVGYGEAFGPARVNAFTIQNLYTPILLGRNPLERETLWLEMYNQYRDHGQKGILIEALSGVDIALWDVAGKYLGLPIYELAGRRYREELQVYATCLYRNSLCQDVGSLIAEVENHLRDGFRMLKLKIGFGLRHDIDVVRAIRKSVGGEVGLMIDANHAYDVTKAGMLARELADCDILWFEEPIVPENLEGYKDLRRMSPIPLAGGEAEYTRYGFRRLIAERVVDIIQPDCCVTGGFSESLKIADMADAWQVRCNPHVWGTGIAVAVGIHLGAMIAPCPPALVPENEPILELDRSPNVLRDKLVCRGLEIADGKAKVPDGPGLGIEIDRRVLERYTVPL